MITLLAATAVTLGGVYYIHESQKQEREVCYMLSGTLMAHLCLWKYPLVQSALVSRIMHCPEWLDWPHQRL